MSTTDESKLNASEGETHNQMTENLQQFTHVDDLKGKAVISITNGTKLGAVDDVAIDPDSRRLVALIMSTGTMIRRDVVGVPADHVQVWGKDAILVRSADVLYRGTNWPAERSRWINALERFKGTSVVSTDGRRLGQVSNILVDPGGVLVGFTIGQSTGVQLPFGRETSSHAHTGAQFISADGIKTLGRDVVIVDASVIPVAESPTTPQQMNKEDDKTASTATDNEPAKP
jgi:sporulation protein YlmC with PRC-barrel domain